MVQVNRPLKIAAVSDLSRDSFLEVGVEGEWMLQEFVLQLSQMS